MSKDKIEISDVHFVPDYLPKLLEKYGSQSIDFEKELKLLEEDKKQNPSLYERYSESGNH